MFGLGHVLTLYLCAPQEWNRCCIAQTRQSAVEYRDVHCLLSLLVPSSHADSESP